MSTICKLWVTMIRRLIFAKSATIVNCQYIQNHVSKWGIRCKCVQKGIPLNTPLSLYTLLSLCQLYLTSKLSRCPRNKYNIIKKEKYMHIKVTRESELSEMTRFNFLSANSLKYVKCYCLQAEDNSLSNIW